MTCLTLDDEPLALRLLESYVLRCPSLEPAGFYTDPDQAARRLAEGDIRLLFLDIQMPDITGLQFLKNLSDPPMVIFTTAYAEYAVEGFNLNAVDYLLKPFGFDRFAKSVAKARDYGRFLQLQDADSDPAHQTTSLFVKVEYSVVQIPFEEIRYIEGFDDYIKIHVGDKPVLTLMSLKYVLELLPPERFVRVHRSFIVAIDRIERVRARKIWIGAREIPVGETYAGLLKLRTG